MNDSVALPAKKRGAGGQMDLAQLQVFLTGPRQLPAPPRSLPHTAAVSIAIRSWKSRSASRFHSAERATPSSPTPGPCFATTPSHTQLRDEISSGNGGFKRRRPRPALLRVNWRLDSRLAPALAPFRRLYPACISPSIARFQPQRRGEVLNYRRIWAPVLLFPGGKAGGR